MLKIDRRPRLQEAIQDNGESVATHSQPLRVGRVVRWASRRIRSRGQAGVGRIRVRGAVDDAENAPAVVVRSRGHPVRLRHGSGAAGMGSRERIHELTLRP